MSRSDPTADFDYVIDNFMVEVFGSNAGVPGDYNNNGTVDAADYVLWRNGGPLANEVADAGTVSAADYTEWRARFGNTSGSGTCARRCAMPEPGSALLLIIGGIVWPSVAADGRGVAEVRHDQIEAKLWRIVSLKVASSTNTFWENV